MRGVMRSMMAAVALSVAVPSPAAAQDKEMAALAEAMVSALRPEVPKAFGDIMLVAVRADRAMVIFTIEIPPGMHFSRNEIASQFSEGFCSGAEVPGWFSQGLRMRVDVRASGGVEPGEVIDRCPSRRPTTS